MSTFKRRIAALLHYSARANNARFSANLLWKAAHGQMEVFGEDCSYGGNPKIAAIEGYHREAAIALELILKANIACQLNAIDSDTAPQIMQEKYLHHRLHDLWKDGNLRALSDEENFTLHQFEQILFWSGRYPTQTSEKAIAKERKKLEPLLNKRKKGPLGIYSLPDMGWEKFDNLYQIANRDFWTCETH